MAADGRNNKTQFEVQLSEHGKMKTNDFIESERMDYYSGKIYTLFDWEVLFATLAATYVGESMEDHYRPKRKFYKVNLTRGAL